MKPVFFSLFILSSMAIFGQSKLDFRSSDSLAFYLKVAETSMNTWPSTHMSFYCELSGKQKIAVQFTNPAVPAFEQTIDIKKNTSVQFELRTIKGIFQFFPISESQFDIPLFTANVEAAADTVTLVMPEYSGRTNCTEPVSEVDFISIKENLSKIGFEFKRFEKLKEISQVECFRVDQLRYLISQLELEDNKVKILELAQPRIYDYDRAALIVDDFFLERNKNKVKELLQ